MKAFLNSGASCGYQFIALILLYSRILTRLFKQSNKSVWRTLKRQLQNQKGDLYNIDNIGIRLNHNIHGEVGTAGHVNFSSMLGSLSREFEGDITKHRQKRVNRKHHNELLKDLEHNREENFAKPAIYQEVSPDAKCFVRIRHLCKTFSKHKIALQEVNMNIYHVCSLADTTYFHKYMKDPGRTLEFVSKDSRLVPCCDRLCIPEKSCYDPPDILSVEYETAQHPKLAADLTALVIQGFFFWILLIISERKVMPRLVQFIVLKFLKNMEKKIKPEKLSRDIREEKFRVHSLVDENIFPPEDILLVKDLTKSYTSTMVINDFTLEVKKGQCVGILGGGGSGKSTIMKMLTGETIPTRGMCYIGRYNLLQHPKEYLSRIGYCPQRNSLFDNFTGVQMLELIGSLKGIPKIHLSLHIKKWLAILGLSDAAKDLCKNYGTGMQRRLCAAMALIGGNKIILLDEPTSGVDPISRQRFWAVIHQLRASGHTIVFSSFNTEECTNLASKLIVISEGNVQCVGSPEELIERFSFGHTVIFRLYQDVLSHLELVSATMGRVVDLKKLIEQTFKYANLVDEQDSILIYFLRNTKLNWSEIFRKCNMIKAKFSQIVESYDVAESLLEDLFILLTNKYQEMDNPRRTEPIHPFDVSKADAELADYRKVTKSMNEDTSNL